MGTPGALALVPLLCSIPVVWPGFANVAAGIAVSGGGRAATAAGVAETLAFLFHGAVASAVLALVAAVRGPHDAQRLVSATALLLGGALAGVVLWYGSRLHALPAPALPRLGALTSALAAAAFFGWAAWRRAKPSPIAVLVIALTIVIAAWQQIEIHRHTAMTGF